MIPQDWQPIGEPDVPELSADAQKVQAYLAEHGIDKLTKRQEMAMRIALRMGFDRLRDAVYEFRKWEAIMARNRLSDEQRAKIIELHEQGMKQAEIALEIDCSQNTVCTVLQAYRLRQTLDAAVPDDNKKPVATVNLEFVQAVKDMIAERDAADAEKQSANAEPDIPDYVLYAVDCRISELEQRLQDFDNQKAMLEHQLRVLQSDISEVQTEHDKLADWKQEVDP